MIGGIGSDIAAEKSADLFVRIRVCNLLLREYRFLKFIYSIMNMQNFCCSIHAGESGAENLQLTIVLLFN
jgi:hypothetical protein